MILCWIALSPFYTFWRQVSLQSITYLCFIYKIYCGLWTEWVSDLQAHPFICFSMTRDSLTFVEDQGMGPSLLPSAQQMVCACPWFNPAGLWVITLAARASNCNHSYPNCVSVYNAKTLNSEILSPSFAYAAMSKTRTWWYRQPLHLLYLYCIPKLVLSAPAT